MALMPAFALCSRRATIRSLFLLLAPEMEPSVAGSLSSESIVTAARFVWRLLLLLLALHHRALAVLDRERVIVVELLLGIAG